MPQETFTYNYEFRTVNVVYGGLIFRGPFGDPPFALTYQGNLFNYFKGVGGAGTRSKDTTGIEANFVVTVHQTSPIYAELTGLASSDFLGNPEPRQLVISSRQGDGAELHKAPVAWVEKFSDVTHTRGVSMRTFTFKCPVCLPKALPQAPLQPVG